jgi:hypothetical protein
MSKSLRELPRATFAAELPHVRYGFVTGNAILRILGKSLVDNARKLNGQPLWSQRVNSTLNELRSVFSDVVQSITFALPNSHSSTDRECLMPAVITQDAACTFPNTSHKDVQP